MAARGGGGCVVRERRHNRVVDELIRADLAVCLIPRAVEAAADLEGDGAEALWGEGGALGGRGQRRQGRAGRREEIACEMA